MSRSFKKVPILKFAPTSKKAHVAWAKRQANRKVRKTKNLDSGKAYTRVYDQYNIHDCINWYPEDEKVFRK